MFLPRGPRLKKTPIGMLVGFEAFAFILWGAAGVPVALPFWPSCVVLSVGHGRSALILRLWSCTCPTTLVEVGAVRLLLADTFQRPFFDI